MFQAEGRAGVQGPEVGVHLAGWSNSREARMTRMEGSLEVSNGDEIRRLIGARACRAFKNFDLDFE